MPTTIRTKFHRIAQLIDRKAVVLTEPDGGLAPIYSLYGVDLNKIKDFICKLEGLPHFVIDDELIALAKRDDFHRSMIDMRAAGVLRLPFPAMVVEFGRGGARQVVFLRDEHIDCPDLPWEHPEVRCKDFLWYGIRMSVETDEAGDYLCISPSIIHNDIKTDPSDGQIKVQIASSPNGGLVPDTHATKNLSSRTSLKDAGSVFYAAAAATLLMVTDGVEREVVDTTRVNKKRRTSGKPLVPQHTYVRIGRVYRSEGSDRSDEYVPRRSPRPHWRRGHLKNVRWGEGREKIRQVFIRPRLVAYRGGPEAQTPSYVVSR